VKAPLGHTGITDVTVLMGFYTAAVSLTVGFYDVPVPGTKICGGRDRHKERLKGETTWL
jgi:hypothetical protein